MLQKYLQKTSFPHFLLHWLKKISGKEQWYSSQCSSPSELIWSHTQVFEVNLTANNSLSMQLLKRKITKLIFIYHQPCVVTKPFPCLTLFLFLMGKCSQHWGMIGLIRQLMAECFCPALAYIVCCSDLICSYFYQPEHVCMQQNKFTSHGTLTMLIQQFIIQQWANIKCTWCMQLESIMTYALVWFYYRAHVHVQWLDVHVPKYIQGSPWIYRN